MSWRIADQPRFARSTDACGGAALSRRISVGPARGRDSTTAVVADPEWLGIADPPQALRPCLSAHLAGRRFAAADHLAPPGRGRAANPGTALRRAGAGGAGHALRPAVHCRRPAAIERRRGAPRRGAAALAAIFRRRPRLAPAPGARVCRRAPRTRRPPLQNPQVGASLDDILYAADGHVLM